MRMVEALAKLANLQQAAITVNDAAACWNVSRAHSAKMLARLGSAGHLVRVKRGLWAFPERIEPFALPEFVTAPHPAYVSLFSALYYHGMISQIPSVIYAVTLGRSGRITTPWGVVSLHRIRPELFFGFEVVGRQGFKVATPEKAVFDFLYLGAGRSKDLQSLPEVEPVQGFDVKALWAMSRRIPSPDRRRRVELRIDRFIAEMEPDKRRGKRSR